MKRMLLISILIIPLSGCGVRAMQQTFHPQYAQWRDNDFSYHEYKIYSDAGLTIGNSIENSPSDATFWKNTHLPPEQAVQLYKKWKDFEYSDSDIEYFVSQNITDPTIVKHWKDIFNKLDEIIVVPNETIVYYIKNKITQDEYNQTLHSLNSSPNKIVVLDTYTRIFVTKLHGEQIDFTGSIPPVVNNEKAYQILYIILNMRNGFSAQQSINNITKFSNYIIKRYYGNDTNNQCSSYERISPTLANNQLGNPNNVIGNCYELDLYQPQVQWLSPKEVIIHTIFANNDMAYYITSDKPIKENIGNQDSLLSSITVIGITPKTFINAFGSQQILHSFKLLGNQ